MKDGNILLTGGNGFLGQVIKRVLQLDYSIKTMGLASGNDYQVDLSTEVPTIQDSFHLIIHTAGKAHVIPRSEKEVAEFFSVNLLGTQNLLNGLERAQAFPKQFIFISTIAVYGVTDATGVDESWPLIGTTPYASSKIQAELAVTEWCRKHLVTLTILRLPLLVGKNAPGNLGAMIRMMRKGLYVGVGNGNARKSMVLAEDVARFIPKVAAIGGTFNLTDGRHPAMREIENAIAVALGRKRVARLPYGLLALVARVGDVLGSWVPLNTPRLKKLDSSLTFEDKLAREKAGWNPRSVIEHINDCV